MKRITNFDHCDAKTPQNSGGGSSQFLTVEKAVWNTTSPTVSRRSTDGQSLRHSSVTHLSKALKYAAMLLLTLTLGVGQMWGDDFEATNISTSGTTKNHVTCKSTAGTITNANICNDNADSYGSGTASMISGSANNNPNQHYIEISAASGYKLVSPVTIHGVAQDNSAYDVCVVYWEGDYTNASFKSWEKVSVPGRKTICDNAKFELTFSGTVRTIRIYKQLYVNNDGFQNSSGTGKTQGGNKNIGVIKITASATSTSGGETPAAPAFTSPAPSPAAAPALQSIFVGETKQFSVSVTGSPTPTYQWYSCADADKTSPSSIGGATSDKYTTSSSLAVGTYYYYCVATNSQGSATSQVFSLQVNPLGSDMTIHTPGTYESTESDGYSCDLVTYDSRRYEVYYLFSANSKLYFTPGKAYNASGAKNLIDGESYSNGVANVASDEWFSIAANGYGNGVSFSSKQQFTLAEPNVTSANIRSNGKIRILVSGYDNFSFVGKDNSNTNQFTVKIDGTEKTYSHSTEAGHIFSFDITTETHYIEITSSASSSDSRFNAFSLRLPCTLTYDANGGTGTMANTAGSGTTTLRTNTYTKAGCTFIGWATSQANANAGTVAYTDGATDYNLSADATLYAVWKLNAPAISCEDNVVTITVPGSSTVYYTTDGSTTPTSESTPYDPENKPVIAANTTFKAIAILANHVSSNVTTQACEYVAPTPPSTKRIYMKCGSDWCNLDPKFFLRSWGAETHTVEMTQMTGCETDTYYGDIPSGNTGMLFTRQKNTTTEIIWSGDDFWGQSVDITIGDDNLFTCTGWNSENPAKGTFSAGTYATPTYTISFAGNGNTDGEMSAISSLACGANQAITANAFVKAGYSFANWTADVAVTVGGASVSAGSAIAGGATIQNITSDITLTAQWLQEIPTSVAIGGTWKYFPGQTISLTATPTGGTSDFTYQWQKYVTDAWQDIEGADEDTYTKANCTISDCGSYRCVVSKLGASIQSDSYDVHIYTLNGNYDGSDWVSNNLTLVSGTTGKVELTLEAGRLYTFKVKDNFANYWFGNANYMLKSTESALACPNNVNDHIRVFTGAAGTYTFTVDIDHTNYGTPEVAVSVTYPSVTHPVAGYVYYDKGDNDWTDIAAHWWKNEGTIAFVEWNSDPWLTQNVEICGKTYYYMPKLEGYDRLIIHKAGESGSGNQTADITVDASSSGKYILENSAEWHEFPVYTVTFNSHGGSAVAEQEVPCGGTATEPTAPTRLNYDFEGWQLAGVDYNFAAVVADNITLDAVWTRKAVAGIETEAVIVDETKAKNVSVTNPVYGYDATYSGTTKYALTGGMYGGTSGQRYIKFTIPTDYTGVAYLKGTKSNDRKLVLIGEATKTAHDNASGSAQTQFSNPGECEIYISLSSGTSTADATSGTLNPGDYWVTSSGGGLDINSLIVTLTYLPTVKLKVLGSVTQTITITVGEKLGEIFASGSLPTLDLAGYTFKGWKNEANDAAVDDNTVISASMVIYADLEAHEYNVTLENGETDGAATVHYGEAALTITTPVSGETGDELDGFYTAATEGTKVADAEGNLIAGVSGYTDANGKWIKESNAVLYTIWIPYVPSSNADLSALSVDGCTLNETFDASTTAYTIDLPFDSSMPAVGDVTATKDDTKAEDPAVSISDNVITIACEAEDGTKKNYTITVTIASSKDIRMVWKKEGNPCGESSVPADIILSTNDLVKDYLAISFVQTTETAANQAEEKSGSYLSTGKSIGNLVKITAKPGYAFKNMSFYGKIETDEIQCPVSIDGGETWTPISSTSSSNAQYCDIFTNAEVHEIILKNNAGAGTWIRHMDLTIINACTAKTIAWTTVPATEYEVGKSGYAIAASANNGTVTYAASNAAITVNESTGALTINSLTNDIDLSASVAAGDGVTYCDEGASVVREEIKTYYLVKFDAQNETAVIEVKYYSGDAAIALPSPSYSGYVFQGWFDAAEEGNQITEAITPSASRTVYAQWIAQCDGPTITTQPASAEYKTGRAAAALACTATAGAAGELTYSWYSCDDAERTNPVLLAGAPTPSTAVAGTFYYYCTVQEAECDVVRTSNVAVITVTEKDPVCIIKATPTSGAEATADGAYKGNAYFKGRSTDKKLNSDYDYVGVKLASGYTFLATDKVVLNQTANLSSGDISKFYIFTEVPADGKTYVTVDNPSPVKGDNGFEMPAGLVGESALYIGRVDANCNPTVGYLAVYRVMNPELVSLSVNSVAAAKGVGNAYSVTLPAGTNLASLSLTERIAWNAPAESDSKQVTTNEGAWAWGDNTYVLTDKDGDATAYTITLIEAAAIDHVAISGTLTVMEDASTTLSAIVYDTNDEPASIQDVTWSVKSGDEALAEVSALGVVTGKAVGTAHIIATSVADPTVSAQVEVTVTAFSGCKKAYWFGYAADAATNNVENNSTVFGNAPSNASNNSGKTIKLIEDEWEVSVSKKTGSIGNFGTFTVPAGYNATLYLVTNTGGSREFQLKQNDVVKYTQNASSGDPVITKFEDVAPGTYSVLSTSNCSGFYMMAAELCRVPMTGIALDITSKSMLTIDPVFQLTPTFTPATATDKRISWTTTDEDVVTVADGIVTPVGEGTATITVTTEDGGYTATCEVTVSEINCTSFDGTIYEMAAKEQATRKDIAVSGGEENEVALTVEDVVYTRGAAASLGVKGSSAKTPRITAKSEEALSSIDYNSADVYVKIPLGCNLRPTDVITFTANDDTKELKLGNTAASVGTISTSSLSYTVESGDALEGRNVLYVWRGDNTGFVSVNVTRVPLVTIESVALADLTIRAGKTNKPQLTVNPDNGTILSAVWEITAATGVTGSTIDAATGDVTAGTLDDPEQEGTITVKVTINEDADLSATCTVTVVGNIAQTDVDGSIIWDWHNTGATSNNQLTNKTDPKKNENFVLANVVPGNANFATDKLVVEGEHLTRDYDKATPYFQGQLVSFRFAEATEGVVRITYSHTAGEMTEEKPAREIYINDVAIGEIADNATFKASELIPVNASEVTITARNINSTAADDKQYLRIAKIEFYALDKVRDDSWIAPRELGTVCYPNGHIVIGADMYKMAGVNENGKFAFDQVDVTEPGVPYLFEATGYEPIKFYKTTAATAEEAGTSNGMVGTFVQKTLSYLTDENTYYFQGAHFYAVTDRSKDLVVPANRCYVDLNEPHPAAAPKAGVRRIVFGVNGTNTATGVENIQGDAVQSAKVLIDGKMYILRGEKMYDATGRLVK